MEKFNEVIARQAELKARELGDQRPLSNAAIGRLTREVDEDGHGLDGSVLSHYRTGRRSNPSARTIDLLAGALATSDHPRSELRAELQEAAGLPVGAAGKWILPDVASLLNRQEQRVVEEVIRTIAALKVTAETGRKTSHEGDEG